VKGPGEPAPEWLIVGRVGKPHGVHGSVLVSIITDFPQRMRAELEVGVGPEDGPTRHMTIHAVREHRGQWLIGFSGIRDRTEVEELRGQFLFLPELPPEQRPEGFFYEHHLVGLECVADDGQVLGTVAGLEQGPGQVRAVVRRQGREYLVPWVPEIVKGVDLEKGTVLIDPPGGLLDDDFVTG